MAINWWLFGFATETQNCEMSQRSANWSYITMGSPSFVLAHAPGMVANSEPSVSTGVAGVPLRLKTRKAVLTVCTYCVGPTSPLVSGGRQPPQPSGLPVPSNDTVGVGSTCGASLLPLPPGTKAMAASG